MTAPAEGATPRGPITEALEAIRADVAFIRAYIEEQQAARARRAEPAPDRTEDVSAFVATWNRVCTSLPKSRAVKPGTPRYAAIVRCLRVEPDLSAWERAMRELNASPHHKGGNESGWVASMDFLLQPSQFQRWLDLSAHEYAAPIAVVPRVEPVWCGNCRERQAIYGPGTRNAHVSAEPRCFECRAAR